MSNARLGGRNVAVLNILADGYAAGIRQSDMTPPCVERAMVALMLEDLVSVPVDIEKVSITTTPEAISIGGVVGVGHRVRLWVDADPLCRPAVLTFCFSELTGYPALWHYGDSHPEDGIDAHMKEKDTPMLHHVAFAYDQYFGTKLFEGKW